MVVPWIGFEFNQLARLVEPTSKAKFVEFVTAAQPENMPGLRSTVLQWPYTEGLRIDEAMHPLTILAVGLYGEVLPNQNGAPIRLVVPWKYGFRSTKSIVRIRFVERQPHTTWERAGPRDYGFYSNVNPNVDHERWRQKKATRRRRRARPMRRTDPRGRQRNVCWRIRFGNSSAGWRVAGKPQPTHLQQRPPDAMALTPQVPGARRRA